MRPSARFIWATSAILLSVFSSLAIAIEAYLVATYATALTLYGDQAIEFEMYVKLATGLFTI